MGGSSGGGGDTKTQTLPPPQLKESYSNYGNQLSGFMQNPGGAFAGYQGPTYAPISPYTQQAVSALANPEAYNQAQGYFSDVANGNYLGLNPQLQRAVIDPAVMASNNSFNALGRFGGAANQEATQRAAMQALLPYYNQERGLQQQAAGLLPSLQQGQAGALQSAGALQQGIGQQGIAEQQAQFAQQHYDPRLAALQAYGGLLAPGSQYNIQTSSSQMPGGSPIAGALGGGLLGLGTATSLFGPSALMAGSFAAPFTLPLIGAGALAGGLLS